MNDRVSDFMGRAFASMTMFWACVVLDLVALPGLVLTVLSLLGFHLPPWALGVTVVVTVVSFVSQTVIQLLALPVLARQNDQQMRAITELLEGIRAQERHEAAELDLICDQYR